jgi:hypothetical protein
LLRLLAAPRQMETCSIMQICHSFATSFRTRKSSSNPSSCRQLSNLWPSLHLVPYPDGPIRMYSHKPIHAHQRRCGELASDRPPAQP